jgi:NADPH:quinone reductase-like Zn-dependent oxidoreductase
MTARGRTVLAAGMDLVFGPFAPRHRVLGSDIPGTVVEVGSRVVDLRPGDAVYGDTMGTFGGFSEVARVPAQALHPKPPELA